jgi:SAM-dependent methyltransferase
MINHPKDIEYFKQYPAKIMETLHALHYTNINATIPFFGPMLYFLLREIGAAKVLEIGHAEGYTAFYLANAVKDNAVRYGYSDARYYGIDIVKTDSVRKSLESYELPVDIRNIDSMDLKPSTFPGIRFDVIFQDGAHDAKHILHEMDILYPQLRGDGQGYWIFHDCFGPAEDGFREVKKLITQGVYKFEFVRLFSPYGIAIMRKIEDWDENKIRWVP